MIGKTLSHYKILNKLGEGGMGEVYLAHDTRLERDVALKVLPEALAADPERRKRFEREAKAVAALKHPNIVTIHAVEEADGHHFIAMEYVEGDTLAERIPERGFDVGEFFKIAVPLTYALSAAHANGIAHRDLKPANIMFDAGNRLKVLDFGLAKLLESDDETDKTTGDDSVTAEGKVLGTAAYMSPEQAEGGRIDHRADVFSLGIIFYEMLTGEKPFKGKTSISTLTSIMRDDPTPLTDIKPLLPRHLGRIVRRCLEKDPNRRFQSVRDVGNDLRDLKEEMGEGDSSLSGVHDTATPDSPKTNILKFVLPAAAVIVVALVAFVMTRHPAQVAEEGPQTTRIAVLPFENLGDAEDEYFSDGITDEITAKLSGIPGLAVISRASAKKYKNTDKSMQTIGSELRVDYILEGTIRWDKSGGLERVRITPQLIDVSEDSQLWAENYEREIDEIFVVQADIAKQIAAALNVTLGGGAAAVETAAPTENLAAYQSYLRALDYDEEDEAGLRISIGLLERAVELDPTFAVAWAELSKNHSGMWHYGFDRAAERRRAAKDAADRAMALGPRKVEPYIALGYYHYWIFRDYDKALEAIEFAESMSPADPRVLSLKGFVLRRQAKLEQALDYMRRSFELDPQNAVTCRDIAYTYQLLHRQDESISYNERAINISPDFWWNYVQTGWAYVAVGDTASAARVLREQPDQHVDKFALGTLELRCLLGQFDRVIDDCSEDPDRIIWDQRFALPVGYWVGLAHEGKGDRDAATRYYEGARARLEDELEQSPDDHRLHAALGLTDAALGQKADAIGHGRRATELVTPAKDLLIGTSLLGGLAKVYALAGEDDLALDNIEYLLENPSEFSVPYVRLEPMFDSLREHPRYKAIIARFDTRIP